MIAPRIVFVVLCSLAVGVTSVHAQLAAQFYWNPTDKADTVIDFGVTPMGVPVQRSFTIRNTGTVAIAIPVTSPDADPYYSIVNVPEIPPQAPPKEEFAGVEPLPYTIPVGQERSFGIVFKSVAGNPTLPPDVPSEALLHLRAVDAAVPLGASVNWTFRLRAMKTVRILASNRPVLRFDSVYVRPQPSAPTERYSISNVTNGTINATVRPLTPLTPVVGSSEFSITPTATDVQFTSKSVLDWVITYDPRDRGADSARFSVVYKASDALPVDSVVSTFVGVGVEQHVALVSATASRSVNVRGDTVDFGDVLADGVGLRATILIKNTGNIRVGIDAERRVGTQRDTTAFEIDRPVSTGGASVQEGDFDTLVVHFVPKESGPYAISYVIASDILRRHVRGAPDSVQNITFYFKGFGLRPQLIVSPNTIDFGTVVLVQNCTSSQDRTVTIKNNGNVSLRVDSIGVIPDSVTVIPNKSFFTIPADGSTTLTCTFVPTVPGTAEGIIRLYTNAIPPIVDIPFTASVVRPDTIAVSLPMDAAARPGHLVRVGLLVQGDRAALTDRTSFVVSYDPSLLVYRSVFTAGGGAEGATVVRAEEAPAGVLHMELQAPSNFRDRDTLCWMVFDAYLGTNASTELSLSDNTVTFGNAGCSSVLNVKTTSGLFHLDSLCGLSYKTVVDARYLLVSDVIPNPAQTSASCTVVTGRTGTITIRVVDAFGREVASHEVTDASVGAHVVPLDVASMPSGMYLVESVQGRFRTSTPLLVRP